MKSVLITGCNRGIGLGLVKEILKLPKPPKHLFATCRDPQKAPELQQLATEHSSLHILQIDLNNFTKYGGFVKSIDDIVKEEGLNLLINNAGIATKSTRINMVKDTDMISSFVTNTVAPVMLSKAFLPLLKKASAFQPDAPLGVSRACIVNISSILASNAKNVEGGVIAYRASKAALNSATKSMSIDLKDSKIITIALHPGWVKTSMGGSNAPLDVDYSTKSIVQTLLTLNDTHNGGFYQYDGKELPW
ncbi:sni family protein [Megaselia abdita]